MTIKEFDQEIEVWKRLDTIFIQPKRKNITKEFAIDYVIQAVSKRFGNLEEKKELITKLQKQIIEIELSILAEKNIFNLKVLNWNECPF